MMKFKVVVNLLFTLTALSYCDGSKILVVLPYGAKSHHNTFIPLVEELARRNHQVTFLTMTKPSKAVPNVNYVVIEYGSIFTKTWSEFASKMIVNAFSLNLSMEYAILVENACKAMFEDPTFKSFQVEVQKNSYDVAIAMPCFSECYLGWMGTLAAPLVLLTPSLLFHHMAWELDIPYPLSYMPNPTTPYTSTMTFPQRVYNVLTSMFYLCAQKLFVFSAADAIASKHLQCPVSSQEALRNASLFLINSHVSLTESKPLMPYVIDIGGMHCRPGVKLPKEFEDFIDGSGNEGFIVMSMGSVVQGNKLPKEFTALFKEVFAKVKQRVIWKFEDTIEGLSPNVMLSKWIPQQDLMAHPKCRLAITHGGLLSLQEVVYHGVPLLGVPLGADRDFNINQAVNKGFALILDWKNSNPEETLNKINSLIHNKQFLEKAKELSVLTRDRPQPPVETAAYWVEYVIRHKGAPHLKNAGAQQLNLIQYLGIDVIAFLFAILFAVLFIVYVIVRFTIKLIIRLVRRPKVKTH